MKKIQILRGTFAKKPNLEDGQMYLAKDTKQVFVGDKAITEGEIEFANRKKLLKHKIEESLKVFQIVYKDLYL